MNDWADDHQDLAVAAGKQAVAAEARGVTLAFRRSLSQGNLLAKFFALLIFRHSLHKAGSLSPTRHHLHLLNPFFYIQLHTIQQVLICSRSIYNTCRHLCNSGRGAVARRSLDLLFRRRLNNSAPLPTAILHKAEAPKTTRSRDLSKVPRYS
jgi:hypothetical protein